MALIVPPFSQYQGTLVPLRGLWNHAPPEGDRFLNAEIDWLLTTGNYLAQQFSVGGNSPVALSQIVALFVDNSRCGADTSFIFPDSAFELVVPGHNQVLAPVLTNALMFYASAPNAITGDVTILQILNSMPPPIPIAPSVTQNHAGVSGVAIANGNTPIVAGGVNGTLNSFSLSIDVTATATIASFQVAIVDGAAHTLWTGYYSVPASTTLNFSPSMTNLDLRFVNGLQLAISNCLNIGSPAIIYGNFYYSTP